ncbi:hypothetical protein [Streptomyces halobius]|uniref:Uncharacterized protein n=1 Tax=Streptomyces halobius TaxID=2879846 RepID=A0ABY4MLE0_9ACTN|nr:hypothetical protein [Streptomyces halobius]UQA97240.1 hypothetical protein K9S39_40045 [Streptomyces halobius]
MLRRMSVVLTGLVVAGFLTSGAAAAADRYDPEASSAYRAPSPTGSAPMENRVFNGLLSDTLNGLVGGRTYGPTR